MRLSYLAVQSTAMRAFVAILTLAAWPRCARARDPLGVPPELLSALRIQGTPVEKLVTCGEALGPAKCLSALSAWRATNAIDNFANNDAHFNLTEDVERFPWQNYANTSDEQIYSELCDGAEKLLQYRSLKLNVIPGYSLELKSKANGSLDVDVYSSDDIGTARSSMKKLRNRFYGVVPFLLIPGLIMSAILPFVLPALKMMVMGVGMLNNMALTSAVFTLLRNNAFTDYHHKKILYVNEGYRNKRIPIEHEETQNYETVDGQYEEINNGEDVDNIEEIPVNNEWMNEFLGHGHKYANIGYKNRRNGGNKKRKRHRHRDEVAKF